MALLQISEPSQSQRLSDDAMSHAIGIDLGTTHSLVSVFKNGKPITLPDEHGCHTLPSCVRFLADGLVMVGEEARSFIAVDSANTVLSVKRLMGRSADALKQVAGQFPYTLIQRAHSQIPYIKTVAGEVTPVEVSAHILSALRVRAERYLGSSVSEAVITVPAYFDDAQRQATRDAAKIAGLKVLRLLNEPTAAALAYGLDEGAEGLFAVYDLGGGTFDVSVLRMKGGVFEVLATAGDSALGGDDIDRLIVEHWLREINQPIVARADDIQRLTELARTVKERLSVESLVSTALVLDDVTHSVTLSREVLNQIIEPLVQRTLKIASQALRSAGVDIKELNDLILVGGSTRTLLIREKLTAWLGRPPLFSVDPDRVVALGAASQAWNLVGKNKGAWLLLDVLPLSLGLEMMGGLVEKVIGRNTPIPIAKTKEFTTYKDGQQAMSIHVLQGERELVKDCRSLARFNLVGIPPMPAGMARIQVTFQVDADGLLCVTAKEASTGVQSQIQVQPSYGLTEKEIADMLESSHRFAKEDVVARQLTEATVDAERLMSAVEAAIAQDGVRFLSQQEIKEIEQLKMQLKDAIGVHHRENILLLTKQLNAKTTAFAAMRMNEGVRGALRGVAVESVLADHSEKSH
jgi:molecular chaperone HscA